MDINNHREIIRKYLDGNCTAEEKELVERWYSDFLHRSRQGGVASDREEIAEANVWANLQSLYFPSERKNHRQLRSLLAGAAAILITCAAAFYFNRSNSTADPQDIAPGYNQAVLSLGDGRTIVLDSAQTGIRVSDERISYNDGASLKALILGRKDQRGTQGSPPASLTLTTPKGGQYQVTLPDGTKVWLNAASSLTYPSSFATLKERRVGLTGEAYFEVAPDKSRPFLLTTAKQNIEVVGTHFNVNSYIDEPLEKTTLFEGAVKVTSGNDTKLLEPGQEAAVKGTVQVSDADMNAALAWKNGKFVFNDESLESIMRKVSRWYNVEVVYEGADKNELFGGSISRYDHVSKVLKKLELTGGIHFKIEGRRITATK